MAPFTLLKQEVVRTRVTCGTVSDDVAVAVAGGDEQDLDKRGIGQLRASYLL